MLKCAFLMDAGQGFKDRLFAGRRNACPSACIPCLWDAVYVPVDETKLTCDCNMCLHHACSNPLPQTTPAPCSPAWVDMRLFLYLLCGGTEEDEDDNDA